MINEEWTTTHQDMNSFYPTRLRFAPTVPVSKQ